MSSCSHLTQGSGVKHDKKAHDGDDDELHVLITAERQQSLELATVAIEKLLIPVDEAVDTHKWKQLYDLSILNGTNRRHNASWASEQGKYNTGVLVACKICGEVSHPTSDCPLKHHPDIRSRIDEEVDLFLAEVGLAAPASESVDAMVLQLMSSIAPSSAKATPAALTTNY